jgi:hypothetical protein
MVKDLRPGVLALPGATETCGEGVFIVFNIGVKGAGKFIVAL